MTGKSKPTADELVAEALKSVERIENERKQQDQPDDDDIDLDAVEVLPPTDLPPSVTTGDDDDDDANAEALFFEEDVGEGNSGGGARAKSDPMLEMMIAAKNEAVAALEQTQKEAKSMQERLQRVSADFENYKKRNRANVTRPFASPTKSFSKSSCQFWTTSCGRPLPGVKPSTAGPKAPRRPSSMGPKWSSNNLKTLWAALALSLSWRWASPLTPRCMKRWALAKIRRCPIRP